MADKLLKSIKFPTLPDRYVIGDSTLTEEGAAADAKATGDEITNVKSDLDDLTEVTAGISFEDTSVTTTWTTGLLDKDGTIYSELTSYIYSGKISVNYGDVVNFKKADDSGTLATATRLCAYHENTAVSALGGDDVAMPYTVPKGIDSIAITIAAGFLPSNFYAKISTPSLFPVCEDIGVKPLFYPLNKGSNKLKYVDGIIGLWIKEPVEGETYYLKEFRFNQNVGGIVYTKCEISSVANGVRTDHTIFNLGNYTPTENIEFFDAGYAVMCIDWSKCLQGDGYAELPSDDLLLNNLTLEKKNTLALIVKDVREITVTDRLVVTQVTETVTTEKQVIESQVDVVDSTRNAANHGVLPSNNGTTNYNNLQTLLDVGGTIVIDVPGIYEMDGMLKIGSNTELIFGKDVYIKQMNSVGGFIVNKGASSNTYNTNIRICGLNLICNNKLGDTSTYRQGLRGKIGFGFVKNLVLDGITVTDIPNATYFIHIAAYENVLIQNCHIEGNKDGVHSSCGDHLTIRNCYFNTKDDPIALNCQDYLASIPYYGWIKNVLIEDCIDDSPSGTGGTTRARSILIYGGAWDDWASGNTYRNGDTIVSSNNCVYRLISDTAISDATAISSTVEPTHLSGEVTESDGCKWRFIQDTPVYNVACENITIRNYYVKCRRSEVISIHNEDNSYVRSIYPSAIMPPHKNLVVDAVVVENAADYFVGIHEPVDNIKIHNSKLRVTYGTNIAGTYYIADSNKTTNMTFIGDEYYRDSSSMVMIYCNQASKVVNVKAYGNYANRSISNYVLAGTVNMIANDLF